MPRTPGFFLALVVLVLVAGAFWYIAMAPRPSSSPISQPEPTMTLNPDDYPKLQERLVGLIVAPDPAKFAKENGFEQDLQDGKVVVVIEAINSEALEELRWAIEEALEGRVETDYENQLQALVPIKALLKLATHPHIEFIRLPVRPKPDTK